MPGRSVSGVASDSLITSVRFTGVLSHAPPSGVDCGVSSLITSSSDVGVGRRGVGVGYIDYGYDCVHNKLSL